MKQVSELSDAELSELFAVKVAAIPEESVKRGFTNMGKREDGSLWGCSRIPDFATSADAVLPWLEKTTELFEMYHDGSLWNFSNEDSKGRMRHGFAKAPTFPRAACIALLTAKGITEVEP